MKSDMPFSVPFGPNLIRVHPQEETKGINPSVPEVKSNQKYVMKSKLECGESSKEAHKTDPTSAVGTQRKRHKSGTAVSHHGEGMSEDEESGHQGITTNDLLDCLLHPDIITRVTDLLLERRQEQMVTSKRQYTPKKKTLH